MKKAKILNDFETLEFMCGAIRNNAGLFEADFYKCVTPAFQNMIDGEKRILFLHYTGIYFPLSFDTYVVNTLLETFSHRKIYMIEKLTKGCYMVTDLTNSEIEEMC